jgi:hypothetical protein
LGNGEPDWEAYLNTLKSLTNVSVIGITDYFTIEGYRKLLEFRSQGRLKHFDLILPNVEFRLDKLVGTSSGRRTLRSFVIGATGVRLVGTAFRLLLFLTMVFLTRRRCTFCIRVRLWRKFFVNA